MDEERPRQESTPALPEDANVGTEAQAPVPAAPHGLALHARRARVYGSVVVLGAAIVVLVVLVAVNTRRVRLSWAVGDTRAPLVWIIVVSAFIGWIAGMATGAILRRRIRRSS